jgi:hypothetical protein
LFLFFVSVVVLFRRVPDTGFCDWNSDFWFLGRFFLTAHIVTFYAPPGSGKSSLAAACYVQMNYQGKNAQLLTEYIKKWADRSEIIPTPLDQIWIAGGQSLLLSNAVRAGYDAIFCESDPLLCAWYAEYFSLGAMPSLKGTILEWEKLLLAKNDCKIHRVFIDLPEEVYAYRYKTSGRWQKFDEIMAMQAHMKSWLTEIDPTTTVVHETNPSHVLTVLGIS